MADPLPLKKEDVKVMLMVDRKLFQQGDQIGQNFTIWAIFYGIG
jgi:hypothetical protein